jgi:hypothetical protein
MRRTEPEQVLEQLQIQYDERAKSMLEPNNLLQLTIGRSAGRSHQGAYFPAGAG